jgi:signal transduction histidine kinase
MWQRIGLKARLFSILAVLVLLTVCGGLVMIQYTYRIENLLSLVTEKHLASYAAAEGLESALGNQKGFVSYYLIDGDPDWLRQLGEYRQIFKIRLEDAFRLSRDNSGQLNTLTRIETEYKQYIVQKDRVIELYRSGRINEGKALHKTVRNSFFAILDLCEAFKAYHTGQVEQTRRRFHNQAKTLRFMTGIAMAASFLIAAALIVLLIKQILDPVHRLALEATRKQDAPPSENDIATLHHGVKDLIQDVDSTRMALEKSRESLLQSEKLAMVGKLAAGMAHSIRNPFTSVKMRLFSLERTLELTDTQQDDLSVISDEIRHIDTIVQNFLEFSRPPKLQFQLISPSLVVDQVLQLLSHRLKSYDVAVDVTREALLPEIEADPEQLKEVLANMIVNACEAMEQRGIIEIVEHRSDKTIGIEIRDNGPGIPETLRDKIFQPFFTTKEDGTGLGLSIATRIIEEHRGRLSVDSDEGRGTAFTIILPYSEVRP